MGIHQQQFNFDCFDFDISYGQSRNLYQFSLQRSWQIDKDLHKIPVQKTVLLTAAMLDMVAHLT